MNGRFALLLASAFLFAAVALGAFGAHALREKMAPELASVYQTAVQYHFWHALGLLALAILLMQRPQHAALGVTGWLLTAGIVLFCGSLYALALTGIRGFGIVTPVG